MKKIYFILCVMFFTANSAIYSQDKMFFIQYSVGLGTGNTHDFISKTSFSGFSFNYQDFINPHTALGFEFGYNYFYEKIPYNTYTSDNESISGIQYRYIHAFPLMATFDYYFRPQAKVNPFAGAALGVNIVNQYIDMGVFRLSEDAAQFTFRPEVGVLFEADRNLDLIFSAKYFKGLNTGNLDGQSYFTLNFGVVF